MGCILAAQSKRNANLILVSCYCAYDLVEVMHINVFGPPSPLHLYEHKVVRPRSLASPMYDQVWPHVSRCVISYFQSTDLALAVILCVNVPLSPDSESEVIAQSEGQCPLA